MSQELNSLVTALLPASAAVRLADLTVADDQLLLHLTTTAATAACPLCATPSATFHSRYQRHLTDVPWGTVQVRLQLRLRKFMCRNPECVRRI